jgi:hypothetical protein
MEINMSKTHKPHTLLFQLGALLQNSEEGEKHNVDHHEPEIKQLTKNVSSIPSLKPFKLNHIEIILISKAWVETVQEGGRCIDPLDLLCTVYENRGESINHLDIIVSLVERNIFYSQKKRIHGRDSFSPFMTISEKEKKVSVLKSTLLENDIQFHRSFIKLLLGEQQNIQENVNKPYTDNKEFLSDWFQYIESLDDCRYNDYQKIRLNSDINESDANDLLKAMEWRDRIFSRTAVTDTVFPLQDMIEEYQLDETEATILVYLVKEELDDNHTDSDDVLQLISRNQHEKYQNREYISNDSKLVKTGLIEITESTFFKNKGSDLRIAPDIVRHIILKSPATDEDRLKQILKGDHLFTILAPKQTFDELILPKEMKDTIRFGLGQYEQNVDSVLTDWGLYDTSMDVIGKVKRQMEPGMLMLFAGPPGTGKTFAAGAIAKALGKNLLITDVSKVQSMWVGQSEKNVQRIFTLFERIVRRTENPPVLLLNEADQFLSKRLNKTGSSVDVMFNSMQNLFLEAFEKLRGVLIATTNMKENLDTAFSRRFHLKLDFPMPGEKERHSLWHLHLPKTIPGANEIDLQLLSKQYTLTGGQITIIVKNAATEAAARKGKNKILKLEDLMKYCEIEVASMFTLSNMKIGFEA